MISPTDAGPVINSDAWEQELAGDTATQTLFLLTRRRFRELEWSEGLTQSKLAERMDLTRAQISRWLSSPSNMTLRTAARLLMAMGRKLDFAVSDPFSAAATPPLAAPAFELDPDYAAQGLRVPLRIDDDRFTTDNPTTVVEDGLADLAPGAPTAIIFNFADFRPSSGIAASAADRPKLSMAAMKIARSEQEADADTGLESPKELERVETMDGTLSFWAWRSIVFVILPSGARGTKLSLGEEQYDLLPSTGGLHLVGGMLVADAVMFAERHRDNPKQYPVVWRR